MWPADALPRYYTTPKEDQEAIEYIRKRKLTDKPLIAVQPFSTDRGRDWPEEHWTCLANSLEGCGYSVVILDAYRSRTRRFKQFRLTGMPFWFLAAFLKQCNLLVCPDSGLFHLSAAVSTPALGLFASPCIWRRLPECRPSKATTTCKVLRQLPVLEVLRKVLLLLRS